MGWTSGRFAPAVLSLPLYRWANRSLPFTKSRATTPPEVHPTASFFLFSYDDRPASVHTITLDNPNFSLSISSIGLSVVVSALLPGSMHIARGKPSLSTKSPI